jgi:hypothetical protein
VADWDSITLNDLHRQRDELILKVDSAVKTFYEETGFEVRVGAGFDDQGSYYFDIDVNYPTGKG